MIRVWNWLSDIEWVIKRPEVGHGPENGKSNAAGDDKLLVGRQCPSVLAKVVPEAFYLHVTASRLQASSLAR